ncbi:MAG: hypothetical protein ACLQVA_07030 [Candidatus Brocadiia bacterium]
MQRHAIAGFVLPLAVAAACQLFAASPASAQAPGAPGGGIFVPKPRGSEDSFDPNAAPAAQLGTTIFGRAGDRLTGSVNSIANGVVRFSGPFFDQEVGIFTDAVRDIQFPAVGSAESGRDLVVLTNDDRLFGKIQGMTPDDVAFDSTSAGFLKISKRCIKQMWFQGSVDALARTNFTTGQPGPLQIDRGGWQIAGGALRISSSPFTATVPLDQSSAVTVVIEFARMGQSWSLSLFADEPGRGDSDAPLRGGARSGFGVEGNALILGLAQNGYSIVALKAADPQHNPIVTGLAAKPPETQEVRFAYDPATSDVRLWVNGQIVNETKAPTAPKQGKYVVFSTYRDNSDLKSFSVLEGVVAPGKVIEETDPNFETVFYQSGERMHAKSIVLADGAFAVQTNFSDKPLSVPAEKVVSVSTSKAERETLPPPEHPVQICLAKSLITVELIELTAKTAVARSPYLGDIKIVREAIQSLRFLAPSSS